MLNEQQEKAVRSTEGRVLILAGAGSGKTRVITHRIAHLIRNCGVPPTAILGLTFTNKAAAEMRHRVEALIGPKESKAVTLSTFHSFCMQILRKEIDKLGYTREFSLYDERDMHRLATQVARELLGHEGELPSLTLTGNDPFTKDLLARLQSTLRAYNAVSFDHLITLTIQLFQEQSAVLEKTQERYRYIMIDEYQDTNGAQLRLAELLAAKYQNICVVGDDDQSIYGWRGADVRNILQFKANTVIKLEQNYRSISTILDAANAVIERNENRHKKKLWSLQKSTDPIEVFHAPTEAEEAQAVAHRIIDLHEKGFRWNEIAVLYRCNSLSRSLELALMQASWQKDGTWVRGIPYEVFGGLEFSERSEIKDIFAYLRTIANPLDQEALLRIINVPRRGISDTLLDTLTQENRSKNIALWEILNEIAEGKRPLEGHPKGLNGIQSLVRILKKAREQFSSGPLFEALSSFVQEINYKKAIEEEVKSEKMREFKWENVQECINAIAEYEKSEEEPSLQHFVANTALGKQQFAPKEFTENKVQLMTLHSAKGLEFPAVFIVGVEDQILPHEKGSEIEEERRLFYVGLTRAQKRLTLSMARTRMRMGKTHPTTPSRFLLEIPNSLLKAVSYKFIP